MEGGGRSSISPNPAAKVLSPNSQTAPSHSKFPPGPEGPPLHPVLPKLCNTEDSRQSAESAGKSRTKTKPKSAEPKSEDGKTPRGYRGQHHGLPSFSDLWHKAFPHPYISPTSRCSILSNPDIMPLPLQPGSPRPPISPELFFYRLCPPPIWNFPLFRGDPHYHLTQSGRLFNRNWPTWTPLVNNSPTPSTLWKPLSSRHISSSQAACPSPTSLSDPWSHPQARLLCGYTALLQPALPCAYTEAVLPLSPGPVSSRSPTPISHSRARTARLFQTSSPIRADPCPSSRPVSCAFRRSQASARSSSDTGGGEDPARGPWPGAKDPRAPPLRDRGGGSSAPRKRSRARRAAGTHHQPPPMVRTTNAAYRPAPTCLP